ncbi:MAG: ABC transporter permease [Ilumatobacteraceae bacterium]
MSNAPVSAAAAMQGVIQHDQLDKLRAGDDAPRAAKKQHNISDYAAPVIGFGGFIGFWYFMSYWGLTHIWGKPKFLITAPHRVIKDSFIDDRSRTALLHGLYWTARVSLIGLVIAIIIGMALAIVMSQARWLERSIWPYLVAMQAIPILALVPIIGSIFGFEIPSRIFVCVLISLFPIVSNTLFGLLSAERGQHDLFTLHHVSRWTRLTKLQLPNAMPTIFTGFRIAAGLSVIGAIVGEIFFKRGDKGVGILLDSYRSRAQFPQMYGALILAAALGIAVFIIFGWFNNLVVGRWYESTRKSS